MKSTLWFLLTTIAFIVGGSAVYYFYGYKDSLWIQGVSYVLVILGWLSLMFAIGSVHIQVREKQKAKPNVLLKLSNLVFFVLYPVGLVGLIAGFVLLEQKKDERVKYVLSTGNVSLTTATIIRIEERRMKSTTHYYAIIEYNASGTKIEQAIKDDIRSYQKGDHVNIKYSMDYPDMFALLPL